MSRPRSRSPHYRRFPWEEPGFDPYKVVAELDGEEMNRRPHHRSREAPEEHWNYAREEMHPEDQRRSPLRDDRQFVHQRRPNQEEFYRRRQSPHQDVISHDDQGLSPLCDEEEDGSRHRGGFREAYPSFENRGRSPPSPPRLSRERLPPTQRSNLNHQHRGPRMGWKREGQGRGRGRGRFRNLSPSGRSNNQRGGAGRERGRWEMQGPNRDRQWEDSYQERNQHFQRKRREMEDTSHTGYRNEEHFGEQRYSMDSPSDGFKGGRPESLPRGESRHSGPLVIEHDHGVTNRRETSTWGQLDNHGDLDYDSGRQRSTHPMRSSQEHFRTSQSRSEEREGMRERHYRDNLRDSSYQESRRTPTQQEKTGPMSYAGLNSTMNQRGRGGFRPSRGRASRGRLGRTGPARYQPHEQQSSQVYQDFQDEEQRQRYQPLRGNYEEPNDGEPEWTEEGQLESWKQDRPGGLDRHPQGIDLDPKMPRQRLQGWNDRKTNNMTVVTEETLTIKVDMSQPVNKNSPLCYSSDRQLSLDLVNVGRQRLEFLPMLEHSGTYRETAMHTGTFAQEIITLVHSVKEQYFRDDGVTLNERFSAPQKESFAEEQTEELTLDERFSSNRGFSLNINSLLDDDEPLFSRMGSLPPARGPGDLRHDLERRRQERLEGVKVTIIGNSLPQHPVSQVSDPGLEYSDDMAQMEDNGYSNWPEEQIRRREGTLGPRRGAPFRQNTGPQRRNQRFGNRLGPMKRQNYQNSPAVISVVLSTSRVVFFIQRGGCSSKCGRPPRGWKTLQHQVVCCCRVSLTCFHRRRRRIRGGASNLGVRAVSRRGSVAVVLKKTLVCLSCSRLSLHWLTS